MLSLFTSHRQFHQQLAEIWQRLYRVAYAWTHDRHLAADLAQEAISRALKNKEKFTDEHGLQLWLFRVMGNCWRDTFRRRRITEDIAEDTLVDPGQSPEDQTDQNRIIKRVRHAISNLNFDQRQVITLVTLEGFSYAEAAQILDIPVGTVMSRICRARQHLKDNLNDLQHHIETKNLWRIK